MNACAPSSMEDTVRRVITRALDARTAGDGRPFVLVHFVTNRCMCACESCLWRHNEWRDLPIEVLTAFYDQARAQGFVAAALTGGEPFLRRDLGRLAAHVKREADMALLVFTTGNYLAERMDEVLPHVDLLNVSIDSAIPARHDAIRGLKGLFARAVEGVRQVRQKYPHVRVQLNTCIQRGIAGEIDALVALSEDLDAPISFDVITEARLGQGGSAFATTSVGLPPIEIAAICSDLIERKRKGQPIVNSERYFQYFVDGRPGYACHLPKMTMFVDGRGNVEDCLNLDQPIANIRETPLAEIMALPRFRALRVDAERCSNCNSPTMVDLSQVWENPLQVFQQGGLALGVERATAST